MVTASPTRKAECYPQLAQKSRFIGVIFLFASKCGNKRGKQFFCTTSESTRARDFLRYNAYIT
jgi:hypothetical protein